jgi:peptide/nickel transport system permease protein
MTEANPALNPRSPGGGQLLPSPLLPVSRPRSLWGDAMRRLRRHRLAITGAAILVLFFVACFFGPLVYTTSPEALDFNAILVPPLSAGHAFGTDELGRDLLARCLYGGRISLSVGIVAMAIAVSIGTVVGALAGYWGRKTDQLLMRTTDLFLSLPTLPLLLLTVYLFRDPMMKSFGPELGIFLIVVVMIGLLAWMATARIVRSSFLTLKNKEFVEAAVNIGVSRRAIMFRQILPNAMSPIIVVATLEVGNAIITESTLSFLGVGFPPDTPTWGRLVTDGSQFLQAAPWLAMIPGGLIFFTVLSINFLGDGLRDALDPRQRK